MNRGWEILNLNYGFVPSELARPMSVYAELRFPATHQLSLYDIYYLRETDGHDPKMSPYINRPLIIDDIVGKRVVIRFLDTANYKKLKDYIKRIKCTQRQSSYEVFEPLTRLCTCSDAETPICAQTSVIPCSSRVWLTLEC